MGLYGSHYVRANATSGKEGYFVTHGGSGYGSVTVYWNDGDGQTSTVYVNIDGGSETVFATGVSGSQVADWIQTDHIYVFRLRKGNQQSNGRVLASLTVTRKTTYTLLAELLPTSNALPDPTYNPHRVHWAMGDGTTGYVYVRLNGGSWTLFASGPSGAEDATWIQRGGTYDFQLRRSSGVVVGDDFTVKARVLIKLMVVRYQSDDTTVLDLRDQLIRDINQGSHGRAAYQQAVNESHPSSNAPPKYRTDFIAEGGPTGGTWKVKYNGNETSALSYNATAQQVQDALRALAGLSAVTVTRRENPTAWDVRYMGAVGHPMTATWSFTGGSNPRIDVWRYFDYAKLFSDYNVVTKVRNETVDEVWVYAGDTAGLCEWAMSGSGLGSDSTCPNINTAFGNYETTSDTRFVVMGLNHQRGYVEQLESYGHRVETILDRKVYGATALTMRFSINTCACTKTARTRAASVVSTTPLTILRSTTGATQPTKRQTTTSGTAFLSSRLLPTSSPIAC